MILTILKILNNNNKNNNYYINNVIISIIININTSNDSNAFFQKFTAII